MPQHEDGQPGHVEYTAGIVQDGAIALWSGVTSTHGVPYRLPGYGGRRRAACRAAGQPVALRTGSGPRRGREAGAKERAMRFVVFDDYRVGVLAPEGVRDVTSVVPGWDPAPPQT